MNELEQLKAELHTLKCKQIPTRPFGGDAATAVSTCGGTDIADLDAFQTEFTLLIENMHTMLISETKILVGTEVPTYASVLKEIEHPQENELSKSLPK